MNKQSNAPREQSTQQMAQNNSVQPHSERRQWNYNWWEQLPTVSRSQLTAAQALDKIIARARAQTDNLTETLSALLQKPAETLNFRLLEWCTVDEHFGETSSLIENGYLQIRLAVEPSLTTAQIFVEKRLIRNLIELAFLSELRVILEQQDNSLTQQDKRAFTIFEKAVAESFILHAVESFNRGSRHQPLKLQSISDDGDDKIAAANRAESFDKKAVNFNFVMQLTAGEASGLVRVFASETALNDVFDVDSDARNSSDGANVNFLKNLCVDEIPVTAIVGEAIFDTRELLSIESGDVIVLERATLKWHENFLHGIASVVIGAAGGCTLHGQVHPPPAPANAAPNKEKIQNYLHFLTTKIARSTTVEHQATMMNANEENQSNAAQTPSIEVEGIIVKVQIELAARRFSLGELARLRPGQILNLGCRPTDPVNLTVNDQVIATGELVNVEGTLGVRLLRLYGR